MRTESDTLTLDELVEAANAKLQQLAPTFQTEPEEFSARTVYYYTRQGILPRLRGKSRAERYPASWVHRLVFVRRLQKQLPHSVRSDLEGLVGEDPSMLSGIARVLESLPEERIAAVAMGDEPVQILPMSMETGVGRLAASAAALEAVHEMRSDVMSPQSDRVPNRVASYSLRSQSDQFHRIVINRDCWLFINAEQLLNQTPEEADELGRRIAEELKSSKY